MKITNALGASKETAREASKEWALKLKIAEDMFAAGAHADQVYSFLADSIPTWNDERGNDGSRLRSAMEGR